MCKEYQFYSKCSVKTLGGFQQGRGLVQLMFQKTLQAFCLAQSVERETLQRPLKIIIDECIIGDKSGLSEQLGRCCRFYNILGRKIGVLD